MAKIKVNVEIEGRGRVKMKVRGLGRVLALGLDLGDGANDETSGERLCQPRPRNRLLYVLLKFAI